MNQEKIKRQLELEQEGIQIGIQKYREQIRYTAVADMPPGTALLHKAIEPMTRAIEEFKIPRRGGSRLHQTRKFLETFDSEEVAFITAKRMINAISAQEPTQRVAISLATMLLDHLEYSKFKKDNPQFLKAIERNLKTSHSRHRRAVIMRAKRLAGIEDAEWTETDKLHIGVKLIELFIESTGLVERVQNARSQWLIQGTEEAIKWIEEHHAKCELLNPLYMPMIVKPLSWESPFGGGFFSNHATLRFKLVKTRNNKALAELADHDMPFVYRSINAVQNTSWRINKKVFEIMQEAWRLGSGIGDLPKQEEEPLPPTPWINDDEFNELKETHPEVIKGWKRRATEVYERRLKNKSKRFSIAQKLWLAEKFKDEEEIFFVWTLDWRGRMYPVQGFINPQSDDSGKALLEFAEGKPIGKRGVYWLAVHLANKYGEDKVSFDERVKWVKDHEKEILDSATNPLDGLRFWEDAGDPWQFLAACFEWAGFKEQGETFISRIAVAMDGTCNGLQNFSAMLLDEVGGAAVNLVPSDTPQDVYLEVVKIVEKKVKKDADEGNELASLWLGKIDRGLAKRNVMTVPYGAKLFGMKEQLMAELTKRNDAGGRYLDCEDDFKPAFYLAQKMYEAIGDVVIAARKAMDWLQATAKVSSQVNQPVRWTTPAGFRIHQYYLKQKNKDVRTFWGSMKQRVKLSLNIDTEQLNKRKQTNGISPNFVHSMDASHLMLTINKCLDNDISSFALIHDSYGTHAANTEKMAEMLREAFIEQYSADVLQKFLDELKMQLPEELSNKLPDVPAKGKLDLAQVRESKYFFA